MENVLFVCVENAGRSQMAEAFFRKYAPAKYNVISAGTTPSSQLNPVVVDATVVSSVTIGENGFLDWTHRPSIVTMNDEGEM